MSASSPQDVSRASRASLESVDPDNRFDAWLACMRSGDFASAWRISDAVLRDRCGKSTAHLPLHQRWLWDGRPLRGERVAVHCYHGLGDTIQFIRYAPLVRRVAHSLAVFAAPELIPLLQTVEGIDCVMPLAHSASATSSAAYVHAEVMELPHVFRTTLDDLPASVPYLHVLGARSLGSAAKLNVGIVWSAGSGWDRRRSIPIAELAPFFSITGVRFHILQERHRCRGLPANFGVMSQRADLYELASFMQTLDLVISVDSMPAHLAGALGVPVWTLLHADPDWRWLAGRNDSPWYPTMRVFRQNTPGEWRPVVANVVAELSRLRTSLVSQSRRRIRLCAVRATSD